MTTLAAISLSAARAEGVRWQVLQIPAAIVAGESHFGWASGRRSADEAIKDALGNCSGKCTVVNVNDKPR